MSSRVPSTEESRPGEGGDTLAIYTRSVFVVAGTEVSSGAREGPGSFGGRSHSDDEGEGSVLGQPVHEHGPSERPLTGDDLPVEPKRNAPFSTHTSLFHLSSQGQQSSYHKFEKHSQIINPINAMSIWQRQGVVRVRHPIERSSEGSRTSYIATS